MRILGSKIIMDFKRVHPQSRNALKVWEDTASLAKWQNIEDIRKQFNSVDYIPLRDQYCFDIQGNKFRLIASVNYIKGYVIIDEIFTHAQYDRWNKTKKV